MEELGLHQCLQAERTAAHAGCRQRPCDAAGGQGQAVPADGLDGAGTGDDLEYPALEVHALDRGLDDVGAA